MRNITILLICLFLFSCKESPVENDSILPNPLTPLKYEFGLCDTSWNFIEGIDTAEYSYSNSFYLKNLLFYNIQTKRKTGTTFIGAISPDDDFILYTPCLLPFIDTSWTEFPYEQKEITPKNYSTLHPVYFAPFKPTYQEKPVYDTTKFELYLLNLIRPDGVKTLIMTPLNFIQEMMPKIKTNVKFNFKDSKFDAKCVEIYFNRILKPSVLTDWKFPRPSADSTLNEFYLENDNKFIADKIKATFYYRKKLIIEIRIEHSTVYGRRYYKWQLVGTDIVK